MTKYNKGFSTPLSIIIIILAIGGIAFLATNKNNPKSNEDSMMKDEGSMMEGDSDAMMKEDGDTMMKDEGSAMMEGQMMSNGGYEDYSADKLAFAEQGKVVLFFYAPWCPTCSALNADINANLSSIPSDILILKTDYDSQTELKKKYGVTYQHTLVEVDAEGNMIAKWSGSPTLASLLVSIK